MAFFVPCPPNECEAVEEAIRTAISGSLIVILSDEIEEVYDRLNYYLKHGQEKGVMALI